MTNKKQKHIFIIMVVVVVIAVCLFVFNGGYKDPNTSQLRYFTENKDTLYKSIEDYGNGRPQQLEIQPLYDKFLEVTPGQALRLENECGVVDMMVYRDGFFRDKMKDSVVDGNEFFRVYRVFDDNWGILRCTDYVCGGDTGGFCLNKWFMFH